MDSGIATAPRKGTGVGRAVVLIAVLALSAATTEAQFSVTWYTLDSGGVLSSAGAGVTLDGTVGQPDPGPLLTGGGFTLSGGFWPVAFVLPGDMNCDRQIDFGDINAFVLALSNPPGYVQQYPDCDLMNADINGDGRVDFGDINSFVALLSG